MLVSSAIGQTLHRLGGDVVFGLMGSGNLAVTNAIVAAGGRFVSARHETGALCMADGYARVSGRLGVASVHQGPGLTNAITGLTEAAKSRTPLILLAADTPAAQLRSNFKIDQDALVESVGAVAERVHGPATAVADVTRAVRTRGRRAARGRADAPARRPGRRGRADRAAAVAGAAAGAAGATCSAVADLLARAERPAIIGGRGAVLSGAGPALRRLGELSGAILATSAVANGLFADDPFAVGISGGFATPTGQRLLAEADVIVAFGASLNIWTTRHGALVAERDRGPGRPRRGGDRRPPAGRSRARRRRARDGRGADRGAERRAAPRSTSAARAAQHRAGGRDRRRQLARRAVRAVARLAGPARR